MEIIAEKYLKARKVHNCDFCGDLINPGEKYFDQYLKDGDTYHWKSHCRCEFIMKEIWEYLDPWDGVVTDSDFFDGVTSFAREFICPQCSNWDRQCGECKDDLSPSSDCLNLVGEILKKFEYTSEKVNVNSSSSRFWSSYRRYLKPRETPLLKYPGED